MNYLETSLDLPLKKVLEIMQARVVGGTSYFGVKTFKNPLDFWIYQEIIFNQQPDVIVEIGNKWGGSALAMAHYLDVLGKGRLIGVDIDHSLLHEKVKEHPRITFIESDAVEAFDKVSLLIEADENVLVIEDSSHTYENTFNVLDKYSALIDKGGYFIVEDSICHYGLDVGPSPGPYEAIVDFVSSRDDFEIDRSKESFLITWNPKGFLVKTK